MISFIVALMVLTIGSENVDAESHPEADWHYSECDDFPRLLINYSISNGLLSFNLDQCQQEYIEYDSLILVDTLTGDTVVHLDVQETQFQVNTNNVYRVCPGFYQSIEEGQQPLYCSYPFSANSLSYGHHSGTCSGMDFNRIETLNSLPTSSTISTLWGTHCFAPLYEDYQSSIMDWNHDWLDSTCQPFAQLGCSEKWNAEIEVLSYGYGNSGFNQVEHYSNKNTDTLFDDSASDNQPLSWDSGPHYLNQYGEIGRWQSAIMTSEYFNGIVWFQDAYQFNFLDRAPLFDMAFHPNVAPSTYVNTPSLENLYMTGSTDYLCQFVEPFVVTDGFDNSILRGKGSSTISWNLYNSEEQFSIEFSKPSVCRTRYRWVQIDVSWDIDYYDGNGFSNLLSSSNSYNCGFSQNSCVYVEPTLVLGGGIQPISSQSGTVVTFNSGGAPVYDVEITIDAYLRQWIIGTYNHVLLDHEQAILGSQVMIL